jgi:phosphotriesterase-related protein
MGHIETVRGPIDARELGMTLMHEHIFIKNQEVEENYPNAEWDEDRMLAVARDELKSLYAKGIHTIVDLTVLGLGRSIPRIQRLAETVDTNIVVATGYYTAEHMSAHFKNHGPGLRVDMPEPLDELFRRDIEVGIAGTGVKAAVIKVVTDEQGITPDVGRILASAARTHLVTGVPISTHTNAALKTGLLQQEFFAKQGVDLDRVVIGHSGDTTDLDYLKQLIDNGSVLGLDRFGLDARLPEADRIDVVVKLVELGYAERITLSHDASFFSINVEPSHRAPEWTHTAISDRILPALRRRGVSDAALEQMMVTNPARILSR